MQQHRLQISDLAIVGSRTIGNWERYYEVTNNSVLATLWTEEDYKEISEHLFNHFDVPCLNRIISGKAKGVDTMAERFAGEHGIEMEGIPARWNEFGKSAGFLRNQLIIEACNAVIAFWDGVSKGTRHSMILAPKMNRELIVIEMLPRDVRG